ncbi:autophagy- protein 2 [Orbilia brochopaga]|uniref:Autophagy-related protein 2 n=1 Tax=Orbilia brochopaga TaxID=3140254 RepID=A0AAV9UFW9_9PEZI
MFNYIPRQIQLKLFRYALSKLDFLDHSTYDVERDFNLSLGLKNELEMRNIGLNLDKLSSMLPLPSSVSINNAKILLLHIRIPTDFHKSPVKVTVSSVIIDAEILADLSATSPDTPSSPEITGRHDVKEPFKLPSGMDLTSSFIQDHPAEAEEVDAVLQSNLSNSMLDAEDDMDGDEYFDDAGIGAPLTFWDFVPSFFERLVDRIEMDIKDISLRLTMPDVSNSQAPLLNSPVDNLTVEFNIESLEIEGVAAADNADQAAASRPRATKTGMRAVRMDGISLSLIGLPDFFESPIPFPPANPGDTDTVTSGSTVLPQDPRASILTETQPEIPTNIQSPSHQIPAEYRSSRPSSRHSQPSAHEPLSFNHDFFARMEEPPQNYETLQPFPPPSPVSNISRTSSSQGSIRSDEINSELLSRSFLQPESEHGLSHSDLRSNLSDDEREMGYLSQQRNIGLPMIDNRVVLPEDDSDEDSLKDEPRDLDLFQEPNTKFFGVTSSVGPTERSPFSSDAVFQPEALHQPSEQRIVVPIPRPAPTVSISQTLSHLEAMNAEFEQHPATDEYTYYEESPDDANEYSNPDLLYLSQPVRSPGIQSPGSSIAGSDMHQADDDHSAERPYTETSEQQVEPKVTYTDADDKDSSESGSVYESYPPSEQDDMPSFISPAQDEPIGSAPTSDTPATSSAVQPDDLTLTIPSEDAASQSDLNLDFQQRHLMNDDNYKVPKDTASFLFQSHTRLTPPPQLPSISPSPPHIEEDPQMESPAEESNSEGSESALAESMLFSHEEAGSLYLSAMGSSQPLDDAPRAPSPAAEQVVTSSIDSLRFKMPDVLIKKSLLKINYVDIFVPGIASAPTASPIASESGSASSTENMIDSAYPAIPGAFSVYAASRSRRKAAADPASSSQASRSRTKPSVSFQTHTDKPAGPSQQPTQDTPESANDKSRVDVEIGTVELSIDLTVGKKLIVILPKIIDFLHLGQSETPSVPTKETTSESKTPPKSDTPRLALSLALLNITLVDKMPGRTLPMKAPGDVSLPRSSLPDVGGYDPMSILTLSITRLIFQQKSSIDSKTGTPQSLTDVLLHGCSVKVSGHEIIGFVPKQRPDRPRSERGGNTDSVLSLSIIDSKEKRQIRVRTVALKFYFPTQELEDMLSYFGGLESMLSLASSSNLSSREPSVPSTVTASRGSEKKDSATTEKQTTLAIDVIGITIELFVSDSIGGIGLSTSPIKIVSTKSNGYSIRIPSLAIFGPDVAVSDATEAASTLLVLNNISIGFDNSPDENDLERLLGMITPSIDRYDNDEEIMVDVLLRQRRRGSVVRVDIGGVSGHMNELRDVSRFMAIAEELAKMATVAKYIPQDERPGMLTLVFVEKVTLQVFAGEEVQDFQFKLGALEICHVAAPALLAVTLGQLSLNRNDVEEWIGESLPRALAILNEKDKNRPMVRVRMIGDEPEPEVKTKIWNTRLEYHVKPVLALLSLTEKDTPDVIATNMVDSIANLAERELSKRLADSDTTAKKESSGSKGQPLRLNLGLSGICIALNPITSDAKALFIVQDGSFICGLSSQQPFSATLILHKANFVAIDNRSSLTTAQRPRADIKGHKNGPKEDLYQYTSQGYVSILTMTSAKVNLKLEDDEYSDEKNMSINVEDVFVVVESCADSTQTVIGVLNGLKPPLPESEEIKYMTEIMPVDVFANLDEDAFVPTGDNLLGSPPRNLRSLEDMPEDLLDDEVPFNSQLIESYYPSAALPSTGAPSERANIPFQPPLNSFHEQVRVVAEEPLTFDDSYFKAASKDAAENEPKIIPRRASIKASVRNVQLIWNLHDGYDWPKTRETISNAVKKVEERASSRRRRHVEPHPISDDFEDEEESETYDVLFNSIYITLPMHRDPKDLSKDIQNQIRGFYDTPSETGSYAPTAATFDSQAPSSRAPQARGWDRKYRRSQRNTMQFELKGVDVDFTIFAPDGLEVQNSVDIRVNDVRVTENVRTSTWRMFLTYMREAGSREKGLPMAHIHVDTLRPIPELAATELSLKVKLLPLRLHVDQDALEFLTRFFEFKDPDAVKPGAKVEEPFIQRCEIDTVRVKLDFKPKRVDYAGLRSGRTTEFMNFFILEEADMELRHVALNGVSGFERLGKDLNNIWMPDIKQNQLPGVLAGVAPFRSLVNIGTGVRDLVKVPVMEYRKDGRLVRSIKKGTQHFVKTSGSEVARLGAKLAIGTQNILEKTEEFLVGEPAPRRQYGNYRESGSGDEEGDSSGATFSPYADQPLGVYRGLVQAKQGFTRNMTEAKEAIMRVPSEAAQGGSAKSAAAAVLRAAPTAVIRPMIGVTEAVHQTLHGIDNTIDKEKRDKLDDKYKRR